MQLSEQFHMTYVSHTKLNFLSIGFIIYNKLLGTVWTVDI